MANLGLIAMIDTPCAILIGAVLGCLGAVPLLISLHVALKAERGHAKAPSIPVGFAAMVQSALIITLGIFLAYKFFVQAFVEIAVTAVLVMLLVTITFGITVWHKMDSLHRNH